MCIILVGGLRQTAHRCVPQVGLESFSTANGKAVSVCLLDLVGMCLFREYSVGRRVSCVGVVVLTLSQYM